MPILNMTGGSSGSGSTMNIFCQPTEPTTKEGIWIQSPTTNKVKNIVVDDTPFTAGSFDQTMRKSFYSALGKGSQYFAPAMYNGKIYVFGGYASSNEFLPIMRCYDTKTNTWSILGTFPNMQLFCYAVGVYNGKIYYFNGNNSNQASAMNIVYKYDINSNSMTQLSVNMPNAVKSPSYFDSGTGFVYMYGGTNGSGMPLNQCCYFDMRSETVQTINISKTGNNQRWYNGFAYLAERRMLFLIGGQSTIGNSWQCDVLAYDPASSATEYTKLTTMPTSVIFNQVVKYKDFLYSFGGKLNDSANEYPSTGAVQIFDWNTYQWKLGKPAPIPFNTQWGGVCVEGDYAYVVTDYATLRYDFINDDWETFFGLPVPTTGVKASVVDNKVIIPCLYLFHNGKLGFKYDYVTNVGEFIPSMPETKTNNYATCGNAGKVYVIGMGNTLFYSYDYKNNSWAKLAALPENTSTGSLLSIGNTIYYLGGSTGSYSGFYSYDIATNVWTKKNPLPFMDKYNNYMCVYNDYIYAFINNIDGATQPTGVWKYDPKTDRWSKIVNDTARAIYADGCVVGSKAYIFGGGDPNNNLVMTSARTFDFNTNCFAGIGTMPTSRQSLGVALAGNKIFVYGGSKMYSSAPYDNSSDVFALESKKYLENEFVIKKTSEVNGNYKVVLYDNKNLKGVYTRLLTTFDDAYLFKENDLKSYPAYYGDGSKWIKFK